MSKNNIVWLMVIVFMIAIFAGGIVYSITSRSVQPQTFNKYKTPVGVNTKLTKSIIVNKCTPDPDVATINSGDTIRFFNADPKAHVIYFNRDKRVVVPATGNIDVKIDFYTTYGPRHYDCDGNKQAGIISTVIPVGAKNIYAATTTSK